MSTILGLISIIAVCGTLLALTMMILVSLPQSPMRAALIQVFGWVFAAFCALYVFSGVDLLPEALLGPAGLPDDIFAAIAAIVSARAAMRAGKDKATMAANKERLEIE